MLSVQEDSYNRLIKEAQIQKSYRIFKQLLFPDIKLDHNSFQQEQHQTRIDAEQQTPDLTQKPETCLNQRSDNEILSQPLTTNPLFKIINVDCHRTRSMNFSSQIKVKLQSFLSYFCRVHNVQYKQGLNQIAAPFVLFTEVGVPLSECYEMFQKFFINFSLNFYNDRDFNGLEMFFRMISIVLRYHCPSLSRYLEVYDIQPQIYALSWLMTLFTSKLSLQMTYLLWSYLIAQNDRYLLFFIVVGIIIRRKDQIIQTQNSSIFKIVTDMIFKNEEELRQVLKISLILRKNTPISLTTFFQQKQVFNRMGSYKQSAQLLDHINNLNLFLIEPKQLNNGKAHDFGNCKKMNCILCSHNTIIKMQDQQFDDSSLKSLVQISNDIKRIKKNIQFVIIDLRKYKIKLNPQKIKIQVHSVDIQLPFQHIETNFLNNYMQSLSSKHFIILLTKFTFEDITFSDQQEFKCAKKLIQVLNSYSFPYLGILEGGYTALSIYQQQFKIKNMFGKQQNEPLSLENEHQTSNCQSNQSDVYNAFQKRQHDICSSVSLLFYIAELRYSNKIKFYHGKQKTLSIITDCYLIVVQQKQGFLTFISYLQHNFSIVPYFFSHFKNVSFRVLKVLPIPKIKSIKYQTDNQSTIVIIFLSQLNPGESPNNNEKIIKIDSKQRDNSTEPSQSSIQLFKKLLSETQFRRPKERVSSQEQPNKQVREYEKYKKVAISLKDKQTVQQMSRVIQKVYRNQLEKKYKLKPKK